MFAKEHHRMQKNVGRINSISANLRHCSDQMPPIDRVARVAITAIILGFTGFISNLTYSLFTHTNKEFITSFSIWILSDKEIVLALMDSIAIYVSIAFSIYLCCELISFVTLNDRQIIHSFRKTSDLMFNHIVFSIMLLGGIFSAVFFTVITLFSDIPIWAKYTLIPMYVLLFALFYYFVIRNIQKTIGVRNRAYIYLLLWFFIFLFTFCFFDARSKDAYGKNYDVKFSTNGNVAITSSFAPNIPIKYSIINLSTPSNPIREHFISNADWMTCTSEKTIYRADPELLPGVPFVNKKKILFTSANGVNSIGRVDFSLADIKKDGRYELRMYFDINDTSTKETYKYYIINQFSVLNKEYNFVKDDISFAGE